jgi:hypothetical protein
MPVLTCPFTAIPAKKVLAEEVRYPKTIKLVSELTIKPTATETWGIEGISLLFSLSYESVAFVNGANSLKALEKSLKFLEKQRTAAKESLAGLEETEGFAGTIYGKATALEKETTAGKQLSEAQQAVKEGKATIEGIEKEIEGIERELKEIGISAARERVKESPLVTTARLYARGNELIWNSQITPLKFFTAGKFGTGASGYATAEWREVINLHTQFDDPLDITERENLTLEIELVSPPEVKEILGGFEGVEIPNLSSFNKFPFELSQVTAVVNYSRQVAG